MSTLTATNIDRLEAALKRGLAETEGDLFKNEDARLRFVRRNYFPYGSPQDHWAAYSHWKDMIASKMSRSYI